MTTTSNSVSANVTQEMKNTGGTIKFNIGIEEDNSLTEEKTYNVAKVLYISLSELSKDGNIVSGTVSTNDTGYSVSATLDTTPVTSNLITKNDNTVSVDATTLSAGTLVITVTCDNSTTSDSETYTLI